MSGMSVFKDREVLITGGLGFIGSNLAIELIKQGARVTIVDNMLPKQGGNFFNIKDIEAQVKVNISDVRNQLSMNHLVKGKDYIFHLAGQVNHVDSMRNPIQDLDINCRGTLVLLEALRQFNRSGKVIYTEFTQERKEVEPGDYYADITKMKEMVKWVPRVSLEVGIQRTIDYYRENRKEYW
ncbi:MAG: CDP-paratose 2-epimerase [Syntrophorhabdus sp. PtaU1.Bin002]|nr:MAG: CDP-paratose 2-epimerase [Syntrophorhabdus sp. PtaU1.Bin002]